MSMGVLRYQLSQGACLSGLWAQIDMAWAPPQKDQVWGKPQIEALQPKSLKLLLYILPPWKRTGFPLLLTPQGRVLWADGSKLAGVGIAGLGVIGGEGAAHASHLNME